jgi:hypothetical protein
MFLIAEVQGGCHDLIGNDAPPHRETVGALLARRKAPLPTPGVNSLCKQSSNGGFVIRSEWGGRIVGALLARRRAPLPTPGVNSLCKQSSNGGFVIRSAWRGPDRWSLARKAKGPVTRHGREFALQAKLQRRIRDSLGMGRSGSLEPCSQGEGLHYPPRA